MCGIFAAVVSTLAGGSTGVNVGFAEGAARMQALFYQPHHTLIDPVGNIVVADTYNQRVRRVAPNGGMSCLFF